MTSQEINSTIKGWETSHCVQSNYSYTLYNVHKSRLGFASAYNTSQEVFYAHLRV